LIILKPVMFLVIHGTPPTRAPLLFEWFMVSSFLLKALIMVDLPTLGIPPIMTQAPTVLNCACTLDCTKVSSLLTFWPFFVLICIIYAFSSYSLYSFISASVLFSFARSILFTTISLFKFGCFSLMTSMSSLFYEVIGMRASRTSINKFAFYSSSCISLSALRICPGNQLIYLGRSLNSCRNKTFIFMLFFIKLINQSIILCHEREPFWRPSPLL